MIPTITMISLTGREPYTKQSINLVNNRGGGRGYPCTLIYFTPPNTVPISLDLPQNWILQPETFVGPLPDFWTILASVPADRDWVFLEDDIHPCLNAMLAVKRIEVPSDVGMLSFVDMQNEWPRPGIWRNISRWFYGSQALKIPASVIPHLQQFGRERRTFGLELNGGWDTWIGFAVEALGLKVAHYSPSLFQHVGQISIANLADSGRRTIAFNFPGEDFDALGECPDPVVPGPWTSSTFRVEDDHRWCSIHRRFHLNGNRCPRSLRGAK